MQINVSMMVHFSGQEADRPASQALLPSHSCTSHCLICSAVCLHRRTSGDELLWSLGPQDVLTLSKAGLASSLSPAFSTLVGLETRPAGQKTSLCPLQKKAYLVQTYLVAGVYQLKGLQVRDALCSLRGVCLQAGNAEPSGCSQQSSRVSVGSLVFFLSVVGHAELGQPYFPKPCSG